MLTMKEIKENQEIMNCLDLEMTPERAVALYLEWGSSWAHGRDFVRSDGDESCYFTIDAWKTPAKLLLVRRNMTEGEVVGEVEVPVDLLKQAVESWGGRKGTYSISENLKEWIQAQLS